MRDTAEQIIATGNPVILDCGLTNRQERQIFYDWRKRVQPEHTCIILQISFQCLLCTGAVITGILLGKYNDLFYGFLICITSDAHGGDRNHSRRKIVHNSLCTLLFSFAMFKSILF